MTTITAAAARNLVVMITLTKEQFEAGLDGAQLTADEWTAIANDVQGRLDTLVDEHLLPDITADYHEGAYGQ